MTAYTYILECADGSFYTGSTKDLEKRLNEHENGFGANYTKKRLPLKLMYFEVCDRIDVAFEREKQIQGWNRKKKLALIEGRFSDLPDLSIANRELDSFKRKDHF
jgi:putative endonuclease